MDNVTSTAVWGSLLSSTFLGVFMGVQAFTDPARSWRYLLFAASCWMIAGLDFLHPQITPAMYEFCRLLAWSFYGASVVLLRGEAILPGVLAAIVPAVAGLVAWGAGHSELSTSIGLSLSLGIAAFSHALAFFATHGYASAVLAAHTAAMALTCSLYHAAVSTGDVRVITVGYIHWVFLTSLAVFFGWIHLPRELRGSAPVRVDPSHGKLFFVAVILAEVTVIAGMLRFFSWPPVIYLAGNLSLLVVTILLFFHHRHRLVIHTDNVETLLEERTTSLRETQDELSRLNDRQAQKLAAQEVELKSKSEVIARQRRLELAAQTAGQAAHDIQNLLSPMFRHLEELLSAGDLPARVTHAARRMHRQAEELLELNTQLLALSRRGRMDPVPVDLAELVEDLLSRYPAGSIAVECASSLWVAGSASQLTRGLTNLVNNALEAQGGRLVSVRLRVGTLVVETARRCHLGFLMPGHHASISVEDSGPGVPEEIREQIFEPFFSSKRGTDRSGSGLGLAIVTAVVDDHRGVLDMETGPQGTRFTLFLPTITSPAESHELEGVSTDLTVLVADDDAAISIWMDRVLSAAGYRVILASDGLEAVQRLQQSAADLMVLDLKMPRLTGFETFFTAIHINPAVRAVVHTSFVAPDESARLQAMGVSAILQKPATRRELLGALRQATLDRPVVQIADIR